MSQGVTHPVHNGGELEGEVEAGDKGREEVAQPLVQKVAVPHRYWNEAPVQEKTILCQRQDLGLHTSRNTGSKLQSHAYHALSDPEVPASVRTSARTQRKAHTYKNTGHD